MSPSIETVVAVLFQNIIFSDLHMEKILYILTVLLFYYPDLISDISLLITNQKSSATLAEEEKVTHMAENGNIYSSLTSKHPESRG